MAADTVQLRYENGLVATHDLPLDPDIALRVKSGDIVLVTAEPVEVAKKSTSKTAG